MTLKYYNLCLTITSNEKEAVRKPNHCERAKAPHLGSFALKVRHCLTWSERGQKTIYDLIPKSFGFVHSVGRLDRATSGLLLFTNDTAMSSFLADPINKIPRTYAVTVWGKFTAEKIEAAKAGVMDLGEHLLCSNAVIEKFTAHETLLTVVLTQGKNREVRRLFQALGHKVNRLHRTKYGPFSLGDIPLGKTLEIPIAKVRNMVNARF
jgi:23S rRNA pseudouridine2605 synthase